MEKAEGPDRELDLAVFEALGFEIVWHERESRNIMGDPYTDRSWRARGIDSTGVNLRIYHPTDSIDAVVRLIEAKLPNVRIKLDNAHQGIWGSTVCLSQATARTPALSLLSAFLKAYKEQQ